MWRWEQFLAQFHVQSVWDFHCITIWSTFNNEWGGVSFHRDIIQMARVRPEARFVHFTR
jgi:DMSO/TMAO reductase YedYZ molybdopterin-dependent catalytic subunit